MFRSLVFTLWQRLTSSSNGEHQMALNRIAAGSGVFAYKLTSIDGPFTSGLAQLIAPVGYIICGTALLIHVSVVSDERRWRRALAAVLDTLAIGIEMHLGGGDSAFLYSGFLWVVVGNGFRFGVRPLLMVMCLALFSFATVIATTPYWSTQPKLSGGLLLGMLIVPLYAGKLLEKLSNARSRAVSANQAKSVFLANVSHELRTPLNAIVGLGSLLEESGLTDHQHEMSSTMLSAARELKMLIDRLLDLSRIEAGRTPVENQDFDLASLCSDMQLIFLPQTRAKGIQLHACISSRTPLDLRGDVGHFREILMNLLGNAVKFTNSGRVLMSFDASLTAAGVVLLHTQVCDTGIGISQDAQPRIFDFFTQADRSIMARFGGTGLGLAITRQLTALLGGEIDLESQPGIGTCFHLQLPFGRSLTTGDLPVRPLAGVRAFIVTGRTNEANLAESLEHLGAEISLVTSHLASNVETAVSRPGIIDGSTIQATFGLTRLIKGKSQLSFETLLSNGDLRWIGSLSREEAGFSIGDAHLYSTFIGLPLTVQSAFRLARICAVAQRSSPQPLSPPNSTASIDSSIVLIADDNEINRTVLKMILTRAGFETLVANNGEAALDLLERYPVDIAIFDLNMPILGGIEATQVYQVAALGGVRTPIVGLTADASAGVIERCLEAGMVDCLIKPVEPAELVRRLRLLLPVPRLNKHGAESSHRSTPSLTVTDLQLTVGSREINLAAMDQLKELGGEEFVRGLVEQFEEEAGYLLEELKTSSVAGDAASFRELAHAIRSSAANMGAEAIFDLTEPWQFVSASQLEQHGTEYCESVRIEFQRAVSALKTYVASLTKLVAR